MLKIYDLKKKMTIGDKKVGPAKKDDKTINKLGD